jgi:hypothetical protein
MAREKINLRLIPSSKKTDYLARLIWLFGICYNSR